MKRLILLFFTVGVVAGLSSASDHFGSVGFGDGIETPGGDSDPCPPSTLFLNYDGSAENGYCWHYGGIMPPYYGAFAECYDAGDGYVCGIELKLTGLGAPCVPLTAYVWDDAGGVPGNVLGSTPGLDPCPVATWPNVSTHDFAIGYVSVNGPFWIGYWADFANSICAYFVAADTDGPGGCPFTNIVPGIGYPSGWQNVSVVWGPTQSIGIGAWGGIIGPIPVTETSWGRIKTVLD